MTARTAVSEVDRLAIQLADMQARLAALEIAVQRRPWNVSWGVVMNLNQNNYNPYYTTTANVPYTFIGAHPFTTVLGRRYRIYAHIRAITGGAGGPSVRILFAGSGIGTNDTWLLAWGSHDSLYATAQFVGTGVASSYSATIVSSAPVNIYAGDQQSSNSGIEDLGPTTQPT